VGVIELNGTNHKFEYLKWTKTLYQDYLNRIANFCRLFYIFCQKRSFLTTPNVENKLLSSYETLESTGEISLNFLEFKWEIHGFDVVSANYLYLKIFRKWETYLYSGTRFLSSCTES